MDDEIRQLELVGWLREYLTSGRSGSIEVTHSTDTVVLRNPYAIEGRRPDLIGKTDHKLIFRLARMGADVGSEQSVEDHNFFGTYGENDATEDAVFILGVPKDAGPTPGPHSPRQVSMPNSSRWCRSTTSRTSPSGRR